MFLSEKYRYSFALCFLLMSGVISAHQQKEAFTTLLFNERSGNIEVMHRFYLHDAEHLCKQLFDKDANLTQDPKTQEKFSQYIRKSFAIRLAPNQTLLLNHVGHELEAKYFWVYQEIPIPKEVIQLEIKHDALREVWPTQRNLVNIDRLGKTRSLSFSEKDKWQTIKF